MAVGAVSLGCSNSSTKTVISSDCTASPACRAHFEQRFAIVAVDRQRWVATVERIPFGMRYLPCELSAKLPCVHIRGLNRKLNADAFDREIALVRLDVDEQVVA